MDFFGGDFTSVHKPRADGLWENVFSLTLRLLPPVSKISSLQVFPGIPSFSFANIAVIPRLCVPQSLPSHVFFPRRCHAGSGPPPLLVAIVSIQWSPIHPHPLTEAAYLLLCAHNDVILSGVNEPLVGQQALYRLAIVEATLP